MSEDKTKDMKCEICGYSGIGLLSISCSDILKFPPKTICTRCLMADQLAMLMITQKTFPEDAQEIIKMANVLLKHKKEHDAEYLREAHEMAAKLQEEKGDE